MSPVQIGTLLLGVALVWIIVASARHRGQLELRARIFELFGVASRRGLPMAPILERMGRSMQNSHGRSLRDLAARLDAGEAFGPSLEAALPKGTLPRETLATIRATEGTAALRETLQNLSRSTDRFQRTHDRISMAFAYPSLLAVALLGTYATTNALLEELPAQSTGAEDLTGIFAHVLAIALWSAMGIAIVAQVAGPSGPIHRLALGTARRLPALGRLLRLDAASRVLRVASSLSGAGLPLGEILRRAAHATRHPDLRHGVVRAARVADEGAPAGEVWQQTGLPDFAIAFATLAVGAAPHEIARRLRGAAAACDRRVERGLGKVLALIQPMMIVMFGILIALHFAMVVEHVQASRLMEPGGSPW